MSIASIHLARIRRIFFAAISSISGAKTRLMASVREERASPEASEPHISDSLAQGFSASTVMSPVGHVTYAQMRVRPEYEILDSAPSRSHECVTRMRLETKFLRLKTPVAIGSRFDYWQVCWLGGWTKNRLAHVVMLVRLNPDSH